MQRKHFVGRGVIRKSAPVAAPATTATAPAKPTTDWRFATASQAQTYRETLIAKGIIRPTAA